MKKTKKLAMIGILGALAFILMMFEIPFPLAPWLKFDLSDIVILFGGMVGGMAGAISITAIKLVLNLIIEGTTTGGIGEGTSFIATMAYIVPVIYLYKKNQKIVPGLIAGTLSLIICLVVLNYFYITPFYAKLYKMDFITDMINKNDGSYLKYIVYYYGLFNLMKGVVMSAIYLVIHSKLKNKYETI